MLLAPFETERKLVFFLHIFREDGTNRNYYEDSSSSAWGPLYQHLYRYKRGISLQKYFRTTKSTFQGLGQAVSDRFDRLQDRFFKKEEPEHLEYQEYYPQYDYEPQYQQQHYGQQGYYDYGVKVDENTCEIIIW